MLRNTIKRLSICFQNNNQSKFLLYRPLSLSRLLYKSKNNDENNNDIDVDKLDIEDEYVC